MPARSEWTTSLKALADDSRLRIVAALVKRPLNVNALSETLELSQYNVSKHLKILREAGLVDSEIKGSHREYFIAEPFSKQLARNRNVLDLGCCTFRFDRLPKK